MKLIVLRYPGTCVECGTRLEAKTQAWHDETTKKITCTTCKPVPEPEPTTSPDPAAASVFAPPTPPEVSPVVEQPPTVTSGRTHLEKGGALEQLIAQVMTANGYVTRTNVIIEGRSGAPHEIDVIGEKADGLTTLNVAVECKAWERPIEKDVVFKFAGVLKDIGMREGIIVALGGYRSGADIAAWDNGIQMW